MLERAATLRAARGPLAGLVAQLLLLVALAGTVGLGTVGWLVGLVSALLLDGALMGALLRDPAATLGPATWVTLTRASLSVGVAALAAQSFDHDVSAVPLVALASVAIALDWVDGRVARRTGTTSALGAWLDGEVDAFLILALSVQVAPSAGWWVLAIGLARYAFLAAGWTFDWMRTPLPRRDWRKTVAASQGIVLTVAAAGIFPPSVTLVLLGLALALLAESFGRDVWWLWRHRRDAELQGAAGERNPAGPVVLTLLALAVVWAALVAPIKPWMFTPGEFVRLPLEGIVVAALVVALPGRARRLVPWVIGPVLGALVLLKLLDIGFFIAFDRPFNPVDDWSYASIGIETTRDTFGRTVADLTVAGAAVLAVAALALPTLAVHRVTRVAVRHRGRTLRVASALAAAWIVLWAFGAVLGSDAGIASTSAVALAVDEVHAVQTDLQDRARFRAELAKDSYRKTSGDELLTALRGKDVLLVFVESYGKLALEGYPFSSGVDAVVDAGTRQLAAAGFSSRSGWLDSSTFGGGSWLAHGSMQSGTWVDSQGRYDDLVHSRRVTLTTAFERAGWRSVADVPSDTRAWPEGTSFYHYDAIYDRRDLGYHGPKYGFASMPDQYVLLALQRFELSKANRPPIFSEIDLVSSHTPWTRIPPFIPWNRVGDGSIFSRLAIDRSGLTDTQQGYSTSIKYTMRTLFSFVTHYATENTVLIVLGDHQPSRVVSGSPGHDVPVSIIAKDPSVMEHIADWGWVNGMRPGHTAPVWPMSAFRNRFLRAFAS